MRSPLQRMLAHLELLRDDVPRESARDVEGAIDGAATLSRMTTTLLDVGRLEADEMPVHRSPTDLSKLAESVVTALHVLQPGRAMAVEASGDPMCNCDPELTRRMIENLVTNAMKHTGADGKVRIVIDGSRYKIRLAVHDEGPGVPPENRKAIFEPFSAEALNSAAGYASSGLGLRFCQLAAEAHGGSIRVQDGVPHGSIFTVELPR
jgi:signal transduction histidine kinase